MSSANQTPRGYKFAPLVASTMANEPARARLLWAIFLVPCRHTTVCRSPALAFSEAIHFAMKRSAPCFDVLHHSPSSWAAVVHWSALMPKALRSSKKHPIYSFSCLPTQPAPPQKLSQHAYGRSPDDEKASPLMSRIQADVAVVCG